MLKEKLSSGAIAWLDGKDEWKNARSFYGNVKNQISDWPSPYRKDRREKIVVCRM